MSFSEAFLSERRRRLADFVWLALLGVYILAGTPLVPFHADEATLIALSRDYADLFIDRDPARARYQPQPAEPDLQALRLLNGSLARYTMGLGWHLAGYGAADLNQQWDWGADWGYNQREGHAPAPGLLLASRWPQAALLAGSVWLLFALGRSLGGRGVAYLATAYYALNPAVLLNGRRAMLESTLLLTEVLVVLAGLWFLRRRDALATLLLGAAAGLALVAKHSNAIVVVAVFAACAMFPLIGRLAAFRGMVKPRLSRIIVLLAVSAGLALAVFVALNPVWWGSSPVEMAQQVLTERAALLRLQVDVFGGYAGRLDQLAGFLRQSFVALPQYYEAPEFGAWIAGQIARYENSLLRGVSIGGSLPGALLLGGLVGAGAWALARRRDIAPETRWVVGVWALGVLAATWLLTPLEWQRYYLPVYPAVGLLGALGVVQVARLIRSRRS